MSSRSRRFHEPMQDQVTPAVYCIVHCTWYKVVTLDCGNKRRRVLAATAVQDDSVPKYAGFGLYVVRIADSPIKAAQSKPWTLGIYVRLITWTLGDSNGGFGV